MKRSEIQVGMTYAVVVGSMYSGSEALAEPATVLEMGVSIDNFSGRSGYARFSSRPTSTSTDGVRVQILDRKTLEPKGEPHVVKTRNVLELWESHRATQRLRAERKAEADQRAAAAKSELEAWTERLGLNSYDLPSFSGGITGMGWDAEYNRNRAALVRVIRAAYELGRKDASAE